MEQNIQEIINTLLQSFNLYTSCVNTYVQMGNGAQTTWEEQRLAYDYWTTANAALFSYNEQVIKLFNNLDGDVTIPVVEGTMVGIGIVGVGIIYNYLMLDEAGGCLTKLYYSTDENYVPTIRLGVGGLPDGTIIYTTLGTYSIHDNAVVQLA